MRERIDGEDISAEQSLAPDAKRRAKNWLLNPAGSCARLFAPVKRRVRHIDGYMIVSAIHGANKKDFYEET